MIGDRAAMLMFDTTLTELYAAIQDDLDVVRGVFDDELASDLPFVNEFCETVRSYRGKMLRPAMLLLAGKACGGITPAHHTLGAVVEMVHMATLVHDDVLDGADERRRRPTIRALSGNVAAVLLGDYLISHAFHLCSGLNEPFASRRIGAATNVVCEGELLQNRHCRDVALTEAEYIELVRRKTGALTAVACELGARYAGADERVTGALAGYGMDAGVAFQIVDDVLDVTGDAGEIGKSLGLDLRLGKHTLPTIHCLGQAEDRTARELADALSGTVAIDRAALRGWLAGTGSIEYALAVAESYVKSAVKRLDVLPPSEARSSLAAMAEFITRRTF